MLFTSGQYHGAMPDELPYISSKAALHELTPSLAVHLAARRITVNCVNPGSQRLRVGGPGGRGPQRREHSRRRWSTPLDTARLVGWLAGDDAEWVTGQTIASDGGWSALNGI